MGFFDKLMSPATMLLNPAASLPMLLDGDMKNKVLGGRGEPGLLGLGSAPVAPSQYEPAQQALIAQMQSRAAGQQPSQAEMLLQKSQDDAASGARSQILSQRGLNPAIAAKLASRAASEASLGGGRQAAMLKAQEQLSAEQALANMLATTRNQEFQREGLIVSGEQGRQLARQGLIQGILQGGMGMMGGGAAGGGASGGGMGGAMGGLGGGSQANRLSAGF